jgi:exopolysaccharide production protein ExoZ
MKWLAQIFEIGHGEHRPLRSMEGLRGFAVFLVFLVHYVTLVEPWLSPHTWTSSTAEVLRRLGNAGVDLFFVLSGYLIYGTLIAKLRPFWQYFGRRTQRIYPTFLAVFAIYLLLSWIAPAHSRIPTDRAEAIVYLIQNVLLLPGLFPIPPLITVAWSLSYEMFYYLVIPLLFVAGILVYEVLDSKAGPALDLTGLAALAIGLTTVSVLKCHDWRVCPISLSCS